MVDCNNHGDKNLETVKFSRPILEEEIIAPKYSNSQNYAILKASSKFRASETNKYGIRYCKASARLFDSKFLTYYGV